MYAYHFSTQQKITDAGETPLSLHQYYLAQSKITRQPYRSNLALICILAHQSVCWKNPEISGVGQSERWSAACGKILTYPCPSKVSLFVMHLDPRLIQSSLGPHESVHQTAFISLIVAPTHTDKTDRQTDTQTTYDICSRIYALRAGNAA